MARHNLSFASDIFHGDVVNQRFLTGTASVGGLPGLPWTHLYTDRMGALASLATACFATLQTVTAAGSLTLVSASITNAWPRSITITSVGTDTGMVFTITGTDLYGRTMTESITSVSGSMVSGAKAFKTVSGITTSSAMATTFSVGRGNIFGLSFRLTNFEYMVSSTASGSVLGSTTGANIIACVTTAATATTGDVRGTAEFTGPVPNGTIRYGVTYQVIGTDTTSLGSTEAAFGVTQA